jgi:SAM-dependent methyltransferase
MINLFSANYLNRKPIEKAMRVFSANFNAKQKVLDIGCGSKPYRSFFRCSYVGLDAYPETKADVIANAWATPFKDGEFDGIILNQSLEHISKTQETVEEVRRILKQNGLAIITVPQTMKNHSVPIPSEKIDLHNFDKKKIKYFNNDYYRFTKFGLLYIFRDFKVIKVKETNGYFATILQLINYFLSSFGIKYLFAPIYFINNVAGLLLDFIFNLAGKINTKTTLKFKEFIYTSLTLNYILIIKKSDNNNF